MEHGTSPVDIHRLVGVWGLAQWIGIDSSGYGASRWIDTIWVAIPTCRHVDMPICVITGALHVHSLAYPGIQAYAHLH